MKKLVVLASILFSSWTLGLFTLLQAQEPFYKGRTIRLVVGSTPGGLYDRWARMFARYMPKYIAGNPEVVVQNMPGASSLLAANYVYNVAKPDGLTLGMVQYNIYMDQLVGRKEVQFEVRKFAWIGSPAASWAVLCWWLRAQRRNGLKYYATPMRGL